MYWDLPDLLVAGFYFPCSCRSGSQFINTFALLSSYTSMTASHIWSPDRTSILIAISSAITSASVDEWETAPCFLHIQVSGTKIRDPIRQWTDAEVHLESMKSPAKLASTNSMIRMSSG